MNEPKPSVLTIEDNLAIRRFIKTTILSQGYQFYESGTGKGGLEIARKNKPDTVLLDLGLPDMDGLQVIEHLRLWTSLPIIVLSARDQEQDKISALDLGADDYLTKPFSVGELNARLRVALRHSERVFEMETPVYQFEQFKIDLVNRKVWLNETIVMLSPIQFKILAVLVKNANKLMTHKQLLKEVWGESHVQDIDYLRIYIHQLRQKIEHNPSVPQYLKTEPGVGYRFNLEHKRNKC